MKALLIIATVSLLPGCASVMNESTHPIKLEARTSDGEVVSGAECSLSNDYGAVGGRSGDAIRVHRSSADLDVTCSQAAGPQARARLISRANAGMWGNIILGGAVGAVIDHSRGTAYTYPTWVQVVFGKTLVFDRKVEKEGEPVVGLETGVSPS